MLSPFNHGLSVELQLHFTASSPGVPPYYMMVRVALWNRCTATPRAPCLSALNRPLGTRQYAVKSLQEAHTELRLAVPHTIPQPRTGQFKSMYKKNAEKKFLL